MKFFLMLTSITLFTLTSLASPVAVDEPSVAIEYIRKKIQDLSRENFECTQLSAVLNSHTAIAAADHNIAVSNRVSLEDSANETYYFTAHFPNSRNTAFVLVILNADGDIIKIENTVRVSIENNATTYPSSYVCELK